MGLTQIKHDEDVLGAINKWMEVGEKLKRMARNLEEVMCWERMATPVKKMLPARHNENSQGHEHGEGGQDEFDGAINYIKQWATA